jgi:hypothetical protein
VECANIGTPLANSPAAKTKIENLGVAALGDEDVRRLDVAVDNPCRVGRVKGIGDLDSKRQNCFNL